MSGAYSEAFVGGSYEYPDARGQSAQRTVNMYPEAAEQPGAKTPAILRSAPGTVVIDCGAPEQRIRGMHVDGDGNLWVIAGTVLRKYAGWANEYRSTAWKAWEKNIAEVVTEEGPISMADNGAVLAFASGAEGLGVVSLTDDTDTPRLVPIQPPGSTEPPFRPTQVVFLLQRFVVDGDPGHRGRLFYTQPGTTQFWDVTGVQNFFTAEQSADEVSALAVVGGRLWIFGKRSREIWLPRQDGFLGYQQGSALSIGCLSWRSCAVLGDAIYWLGSSNSGVGIAFMSGPDGTPKRISTNALEYEWADWAERGSAMGFAYAWRGHQFWTLRFEKAGKTLVYDAVQNAWHERTIWDWERGKTVAWNCDLGVEFGGEIVTGGAFDGILMRLVEGGHDFFRSSDPSTPGRTQSSVIRRERVSPIYWSDLDYAILAQVFLDGEFGLGAPDALGYVDPIGGEPKAMLAISTDGARTWTELGERSLGWEGQYRMAPRWWNCGFGRSFYVRVRVVSHKPTTLYGLRIDLQKAAAS